MELEEKGKKFSVMKAETSQITENIEMGMTDKANKGYGRQPRLA